MASPGVKEKEGQIRDIREKGDIPCETHVKRPGGVKAGYCWSRDKRLLHFLKERSVNYADHMQTKTAY
jgi:hypothetical protein